MKQPYVIGSIDGFVHYVAASLLPHGYHYFVLGNIPERKDPLITDQKLIERYGCDASKWQRARRKRAGLANVRYVRFERTFLLVATKGRSEFFERERFRDARRSPIRFAGYSVSFRGGHGSVRIERTQYLELKAYFLEQAPKRSLAWFEREFRALPFRPYAPVRRQLGTILRRVNEKRLWAGLELVNGRPFRWERWVGRVFETVD
jgi:hypothetical protein